MQIPEGEYRVGTDDDYYVRTNVWSAPGCHGAACGAILHIKDGKFVDIEGDEQSHHAGAFVHQMPEHD